MTNLWNYESEQICIVLSLKRRQNFKVLFLVTRVVQSLSKKRTHAVLNRGLMTGGGLGLLPSWKRRWDGGRGEEWETE